MCDESPACRCLGDECVILLHGYGRTACSMLGLKWDLRRAGYRVINVNYPASRFLVEELANQFLHRIIEDNDVNSMRRVHFVTHSLGGIIVRRYLANHSLDNLGRVVMLAPPNHGSAIVDRLRKGALIRRFTGQSRLQLGTTENDLPRKLGPAQFECGIIAGDRSLNPLLSRCLSGPNDGKVTVESARLDGMRDFLTVRSTHTWMMWRKHVIRQAVHFLQNGEFDHRAHIGV
jgi:triacylglycerol lipase